MPINAFVYVIESPSPEDLLDGRTEGRTLCESLRLSNTPHWYSLAVTRQSLIEALDSRLRQAWEHFKVPPILHLSMHGNDEGVQLTNGQFITWDALRTTLQPLNNWMRGGLLIAMSACYGVAGCRMAMHTNNEPVFWSLVGNSGAASWSDAAVAYVTFYHHLFKGASVEDCVQRMRVASGDDNFIHMVGAHTQQSWIAYLRQQTAAATLTVPPPTPTPLPAPAR